MFLLPGMNPGGLAGTSCKFHSIVIGPSLWTFGAKFICLDLLNFCDSDKVSSIVLWLWRLPG